MLGKALLIFGQQGIRARVPWEIRRQIGIAEFPLIGQRFLALQIILEKQTGGIRIIPRSARPACQQVFGLGRTILLPAGASSASKSRLRLRSCAKSEGGPWECHAHDWLIWPSCEGAGLVESRG